MNRRSFLRGASLLPLPLLVNQFKLAALTQPFLSQLMDAEDDRVLIIVQLTGGNDGLNMVIPVDQYANLKAVRSNLLVPENKMLKIEDNLALHPVMGGLRSLYDDGKLTALQSVGYPEQNRSHFRSTDIWNTGSASGEVITTGWVGRHLDRRYPGFPDAYPNVEEPAPFAVVMGKSVSETCQGTVGNYSIAINDIERVGQLPSYSDGVDTNTLYGRELDWLRTSISQSNRYAVTINQAVAAGNSLAAYPDDNELAQKLRSVARLISGGLKTRVYIVELGGFDTHADQVVSNATDTGEHAELLKTLSDAITAFQADLKALSLEERVVGMTFSEFGRRIRSNASNGSDHGDAAPLFVFGSCVNAGIKGQNVEIDPEIGQGEAVPMQFDFRNVYGSILVDWFGVDTTDVEEMLIDDFTYIPIVAKCNETTSTQGGGDAGAVELKISPNPSRERFYVSFTTGNERVRLTLFNATGQQLRVVMDRRLRTGEHRVPLELGDLPAGAYHVHMTLAGGRRATKRIVKQ